MKTGYETPGRSSNGPSIIMDKADHKIFSTSKRGHVDAYKAQGFTDSSYTRDVVIIELKEMLSSKYPKGKYIPHVEEYIQKHGHIWNITKGDIGL